MDFPVRPEELTPGWLNDALRPLGRSIRRGWSPCQVSPLAEKQGFYGQVVRDPGL